MIEQTLQEIGFTQNEIKVYLALLDLGESKSGEILKKSILCPEEQGQVFQPCGPFEGPGFSS